MRTFMVGFFIVIFMCALALAGIRYDVIYKNDTPGMSEKAVEEIISSALSLNEESAPYFQATVEVYTKAGGDEDYFVVTLFRSDCYLATVYRLDYRDAEIVAVISDYVEENHEEELCGTCPDPEVEVLISYIEDALFPGSIQHGWGTYQMALGEGLNTVLLIGHRETKSAVIDYLACPKLKVWGRIGHGTENSITFNDYQGKLTTSDLASLSGDINGKTFIFNSCLCHNPPFEPAMMDAGAYFFAGGDISLSGGKEGVFSSFFTKAIKQEMELTQAMDEAVSENNYPNAWGYSGDGSAPYYLEFGVTDVSNTPSIVTADFSILVTSDRVQFNTYRTSPVSILSIFNPFGRLIYQDILSSEARTWNMTTTNGRKVTDGKYIAVIKDRAGTGSIEKTFTIIK